MWVTDNSCTVFILVLMNEKDRARRNDEGGESWQVERQDFRKRTQRMREEEELWKEVSLHVYSLHRRRSVQPTGELEK